MPYRNLVSCHVSDNVRDRFYALAQSRGLPVASLLRQMIFRELTESVDDRLEQRRQLLFVTLGIDRLLAAHPDPTLRAQLLRDWQGRLAEEGPDYAA